jgi:Smg protein
MKRAGDRVNRIVEYLIQKFIDASENIFSDGERIPESLLEKGFTESEIEKAVDWLSRRLKENQTNNLTYQPIKNQPSVRYLNKVESDYFTPDAHAYIIQLQSIGILSPTQAEQVIEHSYLLGMSKISLQELKAIVFQYMMLKKSDSSKSSSFYHPGNEKIN